MVTREEIQKLDLEEVLALATGLTDVILEKVRGAALTTEMGIEILSITYTSIRPSLEIAKALEAEYRESLLRKADEAIHARRAAAVEQEQKIKENELKANISLEEQRKEYIDLKNENLLKEAEYKAMAEKILLDVYERVDPRVLLGLALKQLAENAIGLEILPSPQKFFHPC